MGFDSPQRPTLTYARRLKTAAAHAILRSWRPLQPLLLPTSRVAQNEDYILDILLETGLVTPSQLTRAKSERKSDGTVIDMLVKQGVLGEEDVSRALAGHAAMDFVDLSQITLSDEIIQMVPKDIVKRFKVMPVAESETGLMIAVGDPLNFDTFDSLHHLLQRDLEFVCATPAAIDAAYRRYYGTAEDQLSELESGVDIQLTGESGAGTAEGDTGDAPIIKMVSMMLVEAQNMRASDIHLEPLEKRFRVRFRIDGVLTEMQNPPKKLQTAIVSRLKIMSGSMSIAEKRLPQDGRIQVKMGKKSIDLRVSTVPTTHGESVVMRILDKSSLSLGLPQLGFLSDDQEMLEGLLKLPDGILLVTGPTGSGKTTTLYGCLHYINKPDKKLITVEDPVEYQMNGINQVQVNADIGMTFPAALRSILRQAPNIIMIGEIRDAETANIAINAALTGHLVFSTLHTNDAPSAVARLVDIGVQPFLVSSAVRSIMAQRLVRRLCDKCKQPVEMSEVELEALGLDFGQLGEASVMGPVGCDACKGRGYKGRMGIFEIFNIDDEVRHMVNQKASTVELRKRAREMGMRTLREDGIRKVLAGLTTAEEVISSTMSDAG
jgi:type IV pilus assembly protein PilB